MEYIADTLGIEIYATPWAGVAKLPHYLTDSYTFRKVTLDGVPCLFIKPVGGFGAFPAIKKHLERIRDVEPLPIVLEIAGLDARKREALIRARLPFVADGSQIYLPFMGVVLREKYVSGKPPGKTLMPASQRLLFHYLYQGQSEMRTSGTAEKLGLSAMQITRAVRQLAALGLVSVRKDGTQLIIAGTDERSKLFEKSKQFLIDPVRKRIYVETEKLPQLPLAGLSALSKFTMLSSPEVVTRAFCGKRIDLDGTDTLIDGEAQTEVEIWQYSPAALPSYPDMVDPLSLAAALKDMDDERVEQAVEELLKEVWVKENDQRLE